MASDGGKGSAPRPFSVSHDEYANSYDRIFGKKKPDYNKDDGALTDDQLQQIEKDHQSSLKSNK